MASPTVAPAATSALSQTSTSQSPTATASNELAPTIASNPTSSDTPVLSKNAQKRLIKEQAWQAGKGERRAKEKAAKQAKQAEKRKLVELGLAEPTPNKKVQMGPRKRYRARIVLDCAFDEKMNDKEVKSMAQQVGFCYSANKNSCNPMDLLVSGFSGRLKAKLEAVKGKPHELWKEMEWWEEGYEELWAAADATTSLSASHPSNFIPDENSTSPATNPVRIGIYADKARSTAPKSSVIYLTGDSPNVLDTIDEGKTYILGGIVDRNRYKNLCLNKAEQQGIQHAQLPIAQFLPEMPTRKILTVNQVYEILVKWVETKDWSQALRAVMPERKFIDGGKPAKKAKKNSGEANTAEPGEYDDPELAADEGEDDEPKLYIALDDESDSIPPEVAPNGTQAEKSSEIAEM